MSFVENLPRRRASVRAQGLYRHYIKRAMDLVLILFLVAPCVPVVLLLALIVRRDGGPVFFGHLRVGQDGRLFRCWKLRTMVPDAEKVLATYLEQNPDAAEEWSLNVKLRDDPRITSVGRFLRASSLDELPQLWNVFLGEMSLVGPRPVTLAEIDKYEGHKECYMALRPGITGLWQVSGRNSVDYSERVSLDAQYFATCSLGQDIKILFRTLGVVLRKTGQ